MKIKHNEIEYTPTVADALRWEKTNEKFMFIQDCLDGASVAVTAKYIDDIESEFDRLLGK